MKLMISFGICWAIGTILTIIGIFFYNTLPGLILECIALPIVVASLVLIIIYAVKIYKGYKKCCTK